MERRADAVEWLRSEWFWWRWVLRLPRPVRRFYIRARRLARKLGDQHALESFTHPFFMARVLACARGNVVEIGTSEAWSAMAFALADPSRRVVTYDPDGYPTRERYLEIFPDAASRVECVPLPGETAAVVPAPVGFVFVDGEHGKQTTLDAFHAWRPHLEAGAMIVFHDWEWEGVRDAILELGLDGHPADGMYFWTAV